MDFTGEAPSSRWTEPPAHPTPRASSWAVSGLQLRVWRKFLDDTYTVWSEFLMFADRTQPTGSLPSAKKDPPMGSRAGAPAHTWGKTGLCGQSEQHLQSVAYLRPPGTAGRLALVHSCPKDDLVIRPVLPATKRAGTWAGTPSPRHRSSHLSRGFPACVEPERPGGDPSPVHDSPTGQHRLLPKAPSRKAALPPAE